MLPTIKKLYMKVKLLKSVGLHEAGTEIDINDAYVMQLERSGIAERFVLEEQKEQNIEKSDETVVAPQKKRGNPNFGNKK